MAFKPGDIVFLEVDRPIPAEAMTKLYAEFKKKLPEIKIVILQHGVRVASCYREEPRHDAR